MKENVWNWPVGILNNLFFLVLFWRSGLFADSGLQLVYVAISLYGWWNWRHGGGARRDLAISPVPRHAALGLGVATLLGTVALAGFLDHQTPSTVPWGDAFTTSASLAAIYLQARKWIETWYVWIVADLVYIALYLQKALWLTAVLYLIFLVMCLEGYREWRQRLVAAGTGPARNPAGRPSIEVSGGR